MIFINVMIVILMVMVIEVVMEFNGDEGDVEGARNKVGMVINW